MKPIGLTFQVKQTGPSKKLGFHMLQPWFPKKSRALGALCSDYILKKYRLFQIQKIRMKTEGFINWKLIKSHKPYQSVIFYMKTAAEFRSAKKELETLFGNIYLTYDRNNQLLPYSFTGLLDQRIFKEFVRRTVTTTQDVSYLQSGYAIVISGYPLHKQEVIEAEPHVLQNETAYWTIYTKKDNDPIQNIIRSL